MKLERLKKYLHYNPDTGVFTWLISPNSQAPKGSEAGYIRKNPGKTPYRHISIFGEGYYAHRLAWFYMTGEWPVMVDHVDHNGLNNMWNNLRDCKTHAENMKNMPKCKANTSGITGVTYLPSKGLFQATLGRRPPLYRGLDFFEACCVRKSAEVKYAYHRNHGL